MTPAEYKALRQQVGSQAKAAELLGVHKQTISDRERGVLPIDGEAAVAMRCMAEHGGE